MLPPDTYSVSQLAEEIRFVLDETLRGVWVAGEVQRPRVSRGGHLYFDLVEKDGGNGVRGCISAVLFRRDHERVRRILGRAGIEIAEGQTLRCLGGLDFYAVAGRLQLIVRDADPLFSLGDLARRRQETVERLRAADLFGRNAGLPWPLLPLRVALLTSLGSAAERDFATTLAASAYRFQVRQVDVPVQGPGAEERIVAALRHWSGRREEIDVVVLVRGGGSRSDLAVFDAHDLAEAVARSRVPVLTGLGHEIDESVADLVAHRSFKTPTAVAEHLVRTVADVEARLGQLQGRLAGAAERRLANAAAQLARSELRLQGAIRRLAGTRRRLERAAADLAAVSRARLRERRARVIGVGDRLARTAVPVCARADRELDRLAVALERAASRRVVDARARIEARQRWVAQLSPHRLLRRGFSITRTVDGALVRSAAGLEAGEELMTQVGEGRIVSRVLASGEEVAGRATGAEVPSPRPLGGDGGPSA